MMSQNPRCFATSVYVIAGFIPAIQKFQQRDKHQAGLPEQVRQ